MKPLLPQECKNFTHFNRTDICKVFWTLAGCSEFCPGLVLTNDYTQRKLGGGENVGALDSIGDQTSGGINPEGEKGGGVPDGLCEREQERTGTDGETGPVSHDASILPPESEAHDGEGGGSGSELPGDEKEDSGEVHVETDKPRTFLDTRKITF